MSQFDWLGKIPHREGKKGGKILDITPAVKPQEKIPFISNEKEYVSRDPPNKKQKIMGSNTLSNSTGESILYTTPSNKNFFITTLTLSIQGDNSIGTTNNGSIVIYTGSVGDNKTLLSLTAITKIGLDAEPIQAHTVNFSMPIRINEGESIKIWNVSGEIHWTYSIIGWEEFK